VNHDKSIVVTITVTCYSWAPPGGDPLFSCGAIFRPPHPHEFGPVFEMALEVWSSFSHHILAAERRLNCRSFDSHMRSKLLQCGEDTPYRRCITRPHSRDEHWTGLVSTRQYTL